MVLYVEKAGSMFLAYLGVRKAFSGIQRIILKKKQIWRTGCLGRIANYFVMLDTSVIRYHIL